MEKDTPDVLIRDHRRQWRDCLYVYPVIARRSKGLSVGVNLNLDKACNYSCVYCQVDRNRPRASHEVQLPVLRDELLLALQKAKSGQLWQEPQFKATPRRLRRVNDIAFSGDGEPTCLANFSQAVRTAAEVKSQLRLDRVKLVVITNATWLQSPQVQEALPILDANNGEIWAKLDAGSEEYFRRMNRPLGRITLDEISRSIAAIARGRPIVIQTLFCRLEGQAPPIEEIQAYCRRLQDIIGEGGQIKLVQVHTVARPPAESYAQPLDDDELDLLVESIRDALPHVPLETFYGVRRVEG